MGIQHRKKLETVKTLTGNHGLALGPVKQVKSLEGTAHELGKRMKGYRAIPEIAAQASKSRSISSNTHTATLTPLSGYTKVKIGKKKP